MGGAPMTRAEAIEALQDQLNEMLFEADEYRHRAREIEQDAEWLADVLDGLTRGEAEQGQDVPSISGGNAPDVYSYYGGNDLGF